MVHHRRRAVFRCANSVVFSERAAVETKIPTRPSNNLALPANRETLDTAAAEPEAVLGYGGTFVRGRIYRCHATQPRVSHRSEWQLAAQPISLTIATELERSVLVPHLRTQEELPRQWDEGTLMLPVFDYFETSLARQFSPVVASLVWLPRERTWVTIVVPTTEWPHAAVDATDAVLQQATEGPRVFLAVGDLLRRLWLDGGLPPFTPAGLEAVKRFLREYLLSPDKRLREDAIRLLGKVREVELSHTPVAHDPVEQRSHPQAPLPERSRTHAL